MHHPILHFLAHVLPLLSMGLLLGTINTGVSSSLLRPQTFHVLTYLLGGRQLTPLPQRAVLIGNKSPAGTATAAVVIPINDPGETDGLFGIGSPLALMARKAFEQAARSGQGPMLYAVPLNETTTATQETITVTGPATADGDIVLRIAGRWIRVGVANGTVQNTIATAIKNALDALKQVLPGTAGVAANVVTFTASVKGTFGNDILFSVESVPAGVTVALAQSVAGVGALDIQSALDALAGQEFDGIAIQTHVAGDVTEINAMNASRWTASEKKPVWTFIGEPGTQGTATPLASSANHEGVVVLNCNASPSLPGEMATAGMVAFLSRNRPNANYDGIELALSPPPIASVFTTAAVEAGLAAGTVPLLPKIDPATKTVTDGVLRVTRLVTTRTTLSGVPYGGLRDIGTSRTGWYTAKQIDIAYAARFGALANPEGVLLDQDALDQIRDMIVNILYAEQDIKILKNVDDDKKLLVVEADPNVAGRVNVDVSYHPVGGLHQLAVVHRVTL